MAEYFQSLVLPLMIAVPLVWLISLRAVPVSLPRETCPLCRYDLTGLPDQWTCPECGNRYTKTTDRPAPPRFSLRRFARVALALLIPAAYFVVIPAAAIGGYLNHGFPWRIASAQFFEEDTASRSYWEMWTGVVLLMLAAVVHSRLFAFTAFKWFAGLATASGLAAAITAILSARGRVPIEDAPLHFSLASNAGLIIGSIAGLIIGHARSSKLPREDW